ncbi:GNAT family N-acetyltransferase [Tropicibacter sp. R16_0]|uniref:GNAT family N-acetyltransferase n=1 Tax=Tropicibacter sp. R16_0 TaxID=2821102 RepID=UPI0025702F5F|nr:GNAT family N-acetyltransferase [Tropicibacter sp. R16_0]
MTLTVRPMMPEDVTASCRILNDIIEAGGTTAHEMPFSEALFRESFLSGVDMVCCHVAVDAGKEIAGFQWLGISEDLPPDCADIATFARQSRAVPGVGRALFAETAQVALNLGFAQINATIRADNVPGLAYYTRVGFQDHSVSHSRPLKDGTLVDRISKRFVLNRQ